MELIDEFRHNVFCRRTVNQDRANKIWPLVKCIMTPSDINSFQIEWNHYLIGELDSDEFAIFFDKHINKYIKNE